ncbi:MAG: hypothetical protein JWM85_1121 [Acidimicrobiaceae bacterium]|nr:hypothetical protein [Acidimicrobiaceae bacterium]
MTVEAHLLLRFAPTGYHLAEIDLTELEEFSKRWGVAHRIVVGPPGSPVLSVEVRDHHLVIIREEDGFPFVNAHMGRAWELAVWGSRLPIDPTGMHFARRFVVAPSA